MDTGTLNWLWARRIVAAARAGGVRHAVMSPGSRSSPLALAFARHPELETHVVLDERSAAFFALGLASRSRRPVAVVATSGSAPAHWHPAVLEADAAGVPLVLFSADRPPELQHCGANQTTEQPRLFGPAVRAAFDLGAPGPTGLEAVGQRTAMAVDRALWPRCGPVHVNVPFREPLLPNADALDAQGVQPKVPSPVMRSSPAVVLPPDRVAALAGRLGGRRGLIVCGPAAHDGGLARAVAELAGRLECPVLADPLSGLRFGTHDRTYVLGHYDAFLRGPAWAGDAGPEWVLRLGRMPVSRALSDYLAMHPEAEHWLVTEAGDWPDPLHRAHRVIHASPAWLCRELAAVVEAPVPKAWTSAFLGHEARVSEWLEEHAAELPLEWQVLRALPGPLHEGTWVFCANSLVIRDVDAVLAGGGRALHLTGQRGLSGIDGNLSSAAGVAQAGRQGVVALVGDLATFHDLTGLGLVADRDVTVVVFNNRGGGIFDLLPQAALPEHERLWRTPQPWSLKRAAHLFGLPYRRVEDAEDFGRTLLVARRKRKAAMIEVRVDAVHSAQARRACWKWAEAMQ